MAFVDTNVKQPVDLQAQSNRPNYQVYARVEFSNANLPDVTVKEVIVGESLLNPSAYTVVTLQSAMYFQNWASVPINWNDFRCQPISVYISDNNTSEDNARNMKIEQHVYRCDNRRFSSTNTGNTEDLSLHSIDESILNDAGMVWQKTWKCATPSQIVNEALQKIGATDKLVSNNTGPGRPYSADSIHPLQVIQQQANVALANGDDPSFIHYMTIKEQTGKNVHNFRSLYDLMHPTAHTPYEIFAADSGISGGTGMADAFNNSFAPMALRTALTFNFPCDYDVLSDLLNGVDCNGKNINSVRTWNAATADFAAVGGAGGAIANMLTSWTAKGTAQRQNTCETNVEKYLLKRQARMGLLEKDKIALRITIPWSPWLHVGQQIKFHWNNRYNPSDEQYGSGTYLIVHMTHNIQYGGYGVTNLDCISNTFGSGG